MPIFLLNVSNFSSPFKTVIFFKIFCILNTSFNSDNINCLLDNEIHLNSSSLSGSHNISFS